MLWVLWWTPQRSPVLRQSPPDAGFLHQSSLILKKKIKKKKWEKHVLVSRGIHWKPSFFRHYLIIFFLPAQHVARLTWVPSAQASSNHHGKKCSLSWASRVQVVKAQVFGEMEARRAQVTSPRHKTSFQQNTSCVPADPHIT